MEIKQGNIIRDKKKDKHIIPLLVLYALIILLASFRLPVVSVGLMGLLLIIFTSNRWGLFGGMIPFFYSSALIVFAYFQYGGILPNAELSRLELLITLHDIGKINISEDILTQKGALTSEEWEIIKKHPEIGFRIAKATDDFSHVAEKILSHHERWDGTGYPRGLKGIDIPLLARITAVADAYEVMSNGRPYKKAMSQDEITEEFKISAGKHFDPEIVKIFLGSYLKLNQ